MRVLTKVLLLAVVLVIVMPVQMDADGLCGIPVDKYITRAESSLISFEGTVYKIYNGEAFYIYPTQDINPNLTVGELFANGPIKIALLEGIHKNHTRVGIEAPDAMTILREERNGPRILDSRLSVFCPHFMRPDHAATGHITLPAYT